MPGSVIKKEAHMYPGINAFVELVADSVSRHMQKHGNNGKARRIVPFGKTDVKPDGADDRTRIDHMLTCCAEDDPVDQPHYAKALCLVEAKYSQKDQTDAYEQLVRYSRNIYANQPHRRFLWGLTVCGTLVRACLLSNDKIYASETVDVASPEGRGRFVGLLVNWSLCEIPRLGYDSTMGCNDAGDKWSIEVFDGDARNTYSNLAQVFPAYSLRGRHTRCFVGTIEADGDEKQVLIKDCWSHFVNEDADSPHADEEGTNSLRDEVTFLREILTKLSAERSLDGKYPRLEMGGVVRVAGRGAAVAAGRNAAVAEDTTTAAMSDLALAKPVPLRKHMRIVMSPVGEPLQTVNSPDELIVAMFDAMEAHTEIVRRCRILHRDISINNILVHRTDGVVGGMLIDFDNAIRVDSNHTAARPDMTGTLPYMSISNLMANDVKRTALDDWESCIYILCWLATMGVNEGDEKLHKKSKRLSVDEWRDGDTETIARWKRGHVSSLINFADAILDEFINHEHYKPLHDLVESLHEGLFFNPGASPLCHGCRADNRSLVELQNGTLPLKEHHDTKIGPSFTDPFARRAEIADMIVTDLLETFRMARNKAKERLRVAQVEIISK
ncbi:hypothetical protein H4R21_000288 [Coemansia helicoidea]|uniref:Uncharacterized protein n=1 Tax=Coemansia helicoidea TaxID=1286919 RepID=A0ACC1LGA4_9FUNG|nr:hypothetical protein H4R21_000288 [Coemansia helicoidea]